MSIEPVPDFWVAAGILPKLALYLCLLGASGLVLVQFVFADLLGGVAGRLRGLVFKFSMLALLAALAVFLLRGAALTGDASGLSDPEILKLLWQTPVGNALVFRFFGLGLIVVGVFLPRPWSLLAVIGVALALWSFTQIGHMSDKSPLLQVVLFAHLAVAAFWVGTLAPLRWLSGDPQTLPEAGQLGHRFGRIASVVVPVLIVAGLTLAWSQVGGFWLLVGSGYGVVLLLKISVVAVLLMLAAGNKLRRVPALLRGDPGAGPELRRAISWEWLAVVAILAVTAALTSVLTPPV